MDKRVTQFTIIGEPASKSNSRRLVSIAGRPRIIKSAKALNYVQTFRRQVPQLSELMVGNLSVTIHIFYASRRPDLDESLILDAMQGFIYANDRQVREKHITWGLDRLSPRAIIKVEVLPATPPPNV